MFHIHSFIVRMWQKKNVLLLVKRLNVEINLHAIFNFQVHISLNLSSIDVGYERLEQVLIVSA